MMYPIMCKAYHINGLCYFGWSRAAQKSNKSCSCGVMMNKRLGRNSLKIIYPATKEILGRGGLVRVVSGPLHFSMGSAYFPPGIPAFENAAKYAATVKSVGRWMKKCTSHATWQMHYILRSGLSLRLWTN